MAPYVTVNVGGRRFQTTAETLSLSNLSPNGGDLFIDRDPDLFAVFLSLLRTGKLPSRAARFDVQDLAREAKFYGLDQLLISSVSDVAVFDPFNLRKTRLLPLNGRDFPSAISVTASGSVHVAHGCKITSFDWSLRRRSTVLTGFPAVDSVLALSPSAAATGAADFPGLQVIDLESGLVKKTLQWQDGDLSTVQGIEASQDYLFGSFESSRRNASAIVAFDLAGGSLRPTAEIARQEVYGADFDSAIPAGNMKWSAERKILMAAGSHGGPSGQRGIIRLWDLRCREAVWERKEEEDCFADVTIVDNLSAMFKVGVNSAEVYMADMRKLGGENTWICLGDAGRDRGRRKEGAGCKIGGYGDQVFCAKGAEVEMWTEVAMESKERVMRRNVLGSGGGGGEGGKITLLGFGGARMVLARKGAQSVEVWEGASGG